MKQVHIITAIVLAFVGLFSLPGPALARNLYIAGDSTASYYEPEKYPRMGWGQVLGDFYGGEITVIDLAKSGRSAKSYIDEGFFAELENQLGAGDVLLVQFAHNDQKVHSPERYAPAESAFKEYLYKYVSMAHDKGATAVLLTPVVRRKFENGRLVPTHGKYPDAIRSLAAATGTPLVDMTRLSGRFVAALGEQQSKAIYLHLDPSGIQAGDNTHFSERGAYAMAALVARELDSLHIVATSLVAPKFVTVEGDGSGDFIHIQDAIDSLDGSDGPAVMMIGPGEFEEKLYLTRDNIALVGAGRDKTTIRTAELRAHWRQTHDDDWGAATVNIKASDLTLMNLRVINDYGIRFADNSHQFTVRLLEGSRIITENSTFIAGGADTMSLWNKQDGMYYHRRSHFEGYTDFVCPRGWSYITDSTFYNHGGAATIWHDGSVEESQKMVIRNSSFDGIEGFILGRRQYDAQYFLLGNRYSSTMADTPIFRVHYEDGDSRNRPNLWGDRYYFSGSVKEGAPFAWLQDNMPPGMPEPTPKSVYNGRWDPEAKLAELKAQMAHHETRSVNP